MLAYHGTAFAFERFDIAHCRRFPGFCFTSNPCNASDYALQAVGRGGDNPRIVPAHLTLRDPLRMDGCDSPDRWFDDRREYLLSLVNLYRSDGILVRGSNAHAAWCMYVVFRDEQISPGRLAWTDGYTRVVKSVIKRYPPDCIDALVEARYSMGWLARPTGMLPGCAGARYKALHLARP